MITAGDFRKGLTVEWDGGVSSARDRKAGFNDAIKQVESNDNVEVFRESGMMLDIEAGYQLTKRMLQQKNPTALFFGYHLLAQGGITYLQETGYRIPEDISVVLIGTPAWADLSTTPYTVINQHEDWVGTTAGRIISYIIKGEAGQPILMEHRHICPCSLIEHKSIMNLSGKGSDFAGN
jgi:DNA-binding LacI/PurR family transcriptional regulator